MDNLTLYEIAEQYRELAALATDPESQLTHEMIADTMQGIEGSFNEKAEKVAYVINAVGSNISIIDSEIKRLQERKKVIQNRDKSIREYLRNNMEALDIKKIECPLFSITLVKGRERVIVDELNDIPDEYVNIKTELVPKKDDLKKALKDKEIPGAHLERGDSTVRIT